MCFGLENDIIRELQYPDVTKNIDSHREGKPLAYVFQDFVLFLNTEKKSFSIHLNLKQNLSISFPKLHVDTKSCSVCSN